LAVQVVQTGANTGAVDILKDDTGSGIVVDIEDDGTGGCVLLDQDGNGVALSIDSEATGQPLIELSTVVANTRGDINFPVERTGNPSGPSEGDMHYNASSELLGFRFDTFTRIFATRYGSNMGASAVLATIATGAVTVTSVRNRLAAESGVTDDVDTINTTPSASTGDLLVVEADTGDTITLKHNIGNIHLDGSTDKALVNGNRLLLMWDGTDWTQLTPMMVLP